MEEDYPIVYKLIAYFLKDEQASFQLGINLNKGLLMSGPVGCGKTALMNLMRYLTPAEYKFTVKPCRDISFEFIKDGYEVIHRYSRGKLDQLDPKIYCFDDLGTEIFSKSSGDTWLQSLLFDIINKRRSIYCRLN